LESNQLPRRKSKVAEIRHMRIPVDRAKIEADARFNGLFVLRTNTKIAAL
jgi:hypothetical protein